MNIRRIVPNITTDQMDESRKFYVEFLGFRVAMDMEWILTVVSPDAPTAQISLVRGQPTKPADKNVTLSIEVGDVEAVHARAVAAGIPIVYPLTSEPWGVRRFHVTDPNGLLVNIMSHSAKS